MKSARHAGQPARLRPQHNNEVAAALVFAAAFVVALLLPLWQAAVAISGTRPPRGNAMSLTISSPSFSNGGDIPKKYTCDGADVSPPLSWSEVPSGTKTFALLADDPDAPVGNWNHWTLWNSPATAHGLPEAVPKQAQLPDGTQQGMNDFHKTGYNGPCPPPGKPHRYYFKLFALDAKLDLKPGASKKDLEAAMNGHILAHAEWMGRYGR